MQQPRVGGREAAAEAGSRFEVDGIGQPHQVDVGPWHHHQLGEAAPTVEPRLVLVVAEVLVTRPTLTAGAAAAAERGRDAVSTTEACDVFAHDADHARELVSR